jgi:hypothetical protein
LTKVEWTEIDRRRDKEACDFGCFKYTGIPRSGGVKIHPDKIGGIICSFDEKEISSMRKKMKNIKEEPLCGSLDERERGPLGNPID